MEETYAWQCDPLTFASGRMVERAAEIAAPIYKHLDWKWRDRDDNDMVPGKKEIAETITDLLQHLRDSPQSGAVSTGGLLVRRSGEPGTEGVEVYFQLGQTEL